MKEGWTTYKTITYTRAVVAVEASSFRSLWGKGSLALIMNLVGGDDSLNKGAAFVDVVDPLDLSCKPLSCWIYVPACGLGDPAEPNFVRLFVKDGNGKNEYGTPMPVVRNQWFEVRLRPSTLEPHEGWMESGFDPHAITRLGVQFGTDSQEAIYRGKVYVDACGWQEIDPAGTAAVGACRAGEGTKRAPPSLPYLEE